jgi:hypothetical protein
MRRLIVLGVLASVGCGADPVTRTPTPETAAQVRAIEQVFFFAEKKGVRVDAVVFQDPDPTRKPIPAAWAVCGARVVGFNKTYIEIDWVYAYIPAYAAHEVCHIHYKHNLPCGRTEPVAAEREAETCARELLGL